MSVTPLHNEKQLLLEIAGGSKLAFNRLVEHYWNRLFQVSLIYLKSPPAAEDVVQDIFLKLWQKREKLSTVESLENYLFIVTRNEVVSAMRKQGPMRSVNSLLQSDGPSTDPDAEQHVAFKRLQALLQTAVSLLPPQQQTAWKLREEGLNQDEIAIKMGVAKNTVKVHIVKALSLIRTYIQKHSDIVFNITLLIWFQKF